MTPPARPPRNKTVAALLATVGGTLGLHRFYLYGWNDWVGWLFPIPSALGWWGVERMRTLGQDDHLSWVLIPLLGLTLAVCGLMAILYALTPVERWNARYNPQSLPDAPPGRTSALTIAVLILAMLGGTIAFMSSLAFSFQHYFEWQVEEGRKISQ